MAARISVGSAATLLLLLGAFTTACSSGQDSRVEGRSTSSVPEASAADGEVSVPGTFVRECGTHVYGDLGKPSRWQRRSIVVGPFALVWIRDAARAPARTRAYQARQVAFKVLAVVKSGREVVLSVPPFERDHVALGYDPSKWHRFPTVANGEQTVIFVACRFVTLAEPTSWSAATQFHGEIIVPRPHCVVLDVRVGKDGPLRRIKTPFGRGVCRTQAA
jgi:hypothetical protein